MMSDSCDSTGPAAKSGFFVGPYAFDGQSEGVGFWEFSTLSDK